MGNLVKRLQAQASLLEWQDLRHLEVSQSETTAVVRLLAELLLALADVSPTTQIETTEVRDDAE